MIRRLSTALILTVLLGAAGCSDQTTQSHPTMRIDARDFEFSVPAKGELISAVETPVNAPTGNRGRLTLAWMAEENSQVKAGEVVARFDGTEHKLEKQRAELQLEKNEISENITSRELTQSKFSIHQQAGEVKQEKEMVEKFSVDDLTVYSKNEIIDQLLSKDYLSAQQLYLAWREVSQLTQGEAQLELLSLEGKTYRDSINLNREALENLEVTAPVDGVFVHSKNWRGEKVREGQSLWPGSKLGYIPSLTELQAKLYVLESEAAGLELGQSAQIRLDAYADRPIKGEVVGLANIAAPRDTRSPTKYFEVTIDLEVSDPAFMRPGQKLEGEIRVAHKPQVISVPNQAVFKDKSVSWVYVSTGSGFTKREVKTGLRSLTQTEITEGLTKGERVALLEPTGEVQ
ncbi:efflux RND transporter periplasmic adaptor subunit [Gilvimarinus xylanilyticus]|uniref:Efflux RND transporter periplasmic adaptor subunit n=1 Tax=Gilvimarinus xylanilyticus TaxID=2944139 RepID=A0A9X2I1J3_9GAMM|nr:efflux RND transporter periplasmic adaptor subunit [Gilvimarinus xylanilyticus]MCP8900421.1 efflux RND transporter periplasmic adaptor subunit [Gilvimarinus xylanilyticus]